MLRRYRWLGLGGLVTLLMLFAPGNGPVAHADRTILVTLKTDIVTGCYVSGTGECTLRDAILLANSSPGFDHIRFSFIGEGAHTITIHSALPDLTDDAGAFVDGYSFEGSSANTAAIGTNANIRVRIHGSGGFDGLRLTSNNNIVRGISITGFGGYGIVIDGNQNEVSGTFVGSTPVGDVESNRMGLIVQPGAQGTRIGGSEVADRNVIAGSQGIAVSVVGPNTFATLVANNLIGAGKDGLVARGNRGWGVALDNATDTVISDNTIAHNFVGGVTIMGEAAVRNKVQRNQIFLNGGLGIDLGPTGVTANDTNDADEGPNRLQNTPVLSHAYLSAVTGKVMISGTMNGNPLAKATDIEVYRADVVGAGPGEGRMPLHFQPAVGTGTFAFNLGPFQPLIAESAGGSITALATSTDGTSEFSANVPLLVNSRPVANAGLNQTALVGANVTLDGRASADLDGKPKAPAYAWRQVAGPEAELIGRTSAQAGFSPPQGGTYRFELVVSDGLDDSLPVEVTVTVGDPNPPIALAQTVSASPAKPTSIRLVGRDTEHSVLMFELVTRPQYGSIGGFSQTSGVALYTAPAGFEGVDTFSFTVSDGVFTSAPATVTIVVGSSFTIVTSNLPEATQGIAYAATLSAIGGGTVTWSVSQGLPPGLVLSPNGQISGTPAQAGRFVFQVTATSSDGATATKSLALTVRPPGERPYRTFAIMSAAQ